MDWFLSLICGDLEMAGGWDVRAVALCCHHTATGDSGRWELSWHVAAALSAGLQVTDLCRQQSP